jgi:hypothetical protein
MKKKAKEKKPPEKIVTAKPKQMPEQGAHEPVDAEAEKPFDFGGIPDRDLKKNLGCG